MGAVKFEFASDKEFVSALHEDLRAVSRGEAGNEAAMLAAGEQLNYDLDAPDGLRALYRQARAEAPKARLKKICPPPQPEAETETENNGFVRG